MDTAPNISHQCPEANGILFWSLNCYGVTVFALLINFVILAMGCSIIFLNSIIVWAVVRRSESEDATDILILSLALADAFYGVFIIYQTAYNVGNWQIFEECMFRLGILLATSLSSTLHMASVSLDCYIKITHPYIYHRLIKKTTMICISVILWIVSFLWGFSPVMGWNPGKGTNAEAVCGFYIVLDPRYRLVMVLLFFIPFMKNIIIYGHIFRIVRRHERRIGQHNGAAPSKKTLKFTKTAFLIIGLYFLCWSPIGIYLILEYCHYLDYMSAVDKGTKMVYFSSLGYLNSLINPIIYAVKISYIKRRFVDIFGKIACCPCFRRVTPDVCGTSTWQDGSTIVRRGQTEVTDVHEID